MRVPPPISACGQDVANGVAECQLVGGWERLPPACVCWPKMWSGSDATVSVCGREPVGVDLRSSGAMLGACPWAVRVPMCVVLPIK